MPRELQRMAIGAPNRWLRLGGTVAFVLIAVVLLLPPLVRATAHLQSGPEKPSSFRMNRGFDVPQSKWKLSAFAAESFDRTRIDVSAPAHPGRHVLADLPLPDHQHGRTPDPLRGPPQPI